MTLTRRGFRLGRRRMDRLRRAMIGAAIAIGGLSWAYSMVQLSRHGGPLDGAGLKALADAVTGLL